MEFDLKKGPEVLKEMLSDGVIEKKSINDVYVAKKAKLEYLKAHNWKLGPTTPFPILDDITKGFKKGGLVGIGAFSNTGKSQLSYHYAQHFLKDDLEVAYFSLEVASEDVLIHIEQYYYGCDYKTSAGKEYNKGFDKLSIYDVGDINGIEDIEKYVLKYRPDIVFIDFIQILQVPGSSEYEKMSEGIRRLQKLAIETGAVIIYLSQVSNDSNRENNVLDINLKGSGNILASSDYVFVMKKGGVQGEIILGLKKNKHGPAWKKFTLLLYPGEGKCVLGEEIDDSIVEENLGKIFNKK